MESDCCNRSLTRERQNRPIESAASAAAARGCCSRRLAGCFTRPSGAMGRRRSRCGQPPGPNRARGADGPLGLPYAAAQLARLAPGARGRRCGQVRRQAAGGAGLRPPQQRAEVGDLAAGGLDGLVRLEDSAEVGGGLFDAAERVRLVLWQEEASEDESLRPRSLPGRLSFHALFETLICFKMLFRAPCLRQEFRPLTKSSQSESRCSD